MKRFGVVLLLISAFTFAAQAQEGAGQRSAQAPAHGPGRQAMHQAIMEKLHLTDQQKEQFSKLRLDMDRKRETNQSKIKMARIDLRELAQADTPDRSAIEKKLKEISDLQYQAKLHMVDHLFAAKAILTPEQQKLWKEHMKTALPEMREIGRQMMQGMRQRMDR